MSLPPVPAAAGLEVSDLWGGYGARTVVEGVSLRLTGGVTALIGSNGAGKTTVLRLITGLLAAQRGRICYDGQPLHGRSPEAIARLGLVLVPEGGGLFGSMSVEENLMMGAYLPRARAHRKAGLAHVFELFPRLRERRAIVSRRLSGGEQQMAAIGRALMARPRILILDEPSLGLAPAIVQDVADAIERIAADGVSVLLCEQNAAMALYLAQFVYVMEHGRIAIESTPDELRGRPEIVHAYLGS